MVYAEILGTSETLEVTNIIRKLGLIPKKHKFTNYPNMVKSITYGVLNFVVIPVQKLIRFIELGDTLEH